MITTDPLVFQSQFSPNSQTMQPMSESSDAPVRSARWPRLMRLSTLAEYLDMSPSSVSQMVKNGHLPPPSFAPTRRLKRWSRDTIDTFFEKKSEAKLNGPTIDELMARPLPQQGGGR